MSIIANYTAEYIDSLATQIRGLEPNLIKKILISYETSSESIPALVLIDSKHTKETYYDENSPEWLSFDGEKKTVTLDLSQFEARDARYTIYLKINEESSESFSFRPIFFHEAARFAEYYSIEAVKRNDYAKSNYFGDALTGKINIPNSDFVLLSFSLCPAIRQLKMVAKGETTKKDLIQTAEWRRDTYTAINFSNLKSVFPDEVIYVDLRIIDILGNEVSVIEGADKENYTTWQRWSRAGELSFSWDLSFTNPLKPYSGNGFTINFGVGTPTGSSEVRKTLSFGYNSRVKTYEPTTESSKTLEKNTIITDLVDLINPTVGYANGAHNITLTVVAEDGFSAVTYPGSLRVEFAEPPAFGGTNPSVTLKYQNSIISSATSPPGVAENEEVELQWPAATDVNNDLRGYDVYFGNTLLSRVNSPATTFKYRIPSLTDDNTGEFQVCAVDSYGNKSNVIPSVQVTWHVAKAPSYQITEISQPDNRTINCNFTVSDWGTHPNYIRGRSMIARVGSSPSQLNKISSVSLGNTDTTASFNFEGGLGSGIIYVQFQLSTYLSNGVQRTTTSSISTLGAVPTVIYRPNGLGLNVQNLESDELLNIQTFGARKNIKIDEWIELSYNGEVPQINFNKSEISGGTFATLDATDGTFATLKVTTSGELSGITLTSPTINGGTLNTVVLENSSINESNLYKPEINTGTLNGVTINSSEIYRTTLDSESYINESTINNPKFTNITIDCGSW